MKITRILPTALALVAITAGAALAAQNVPATPTGMQSCPGYGAMQGRHAAMSANMGQMMQNGGHMMGNGQHMMQNGGQHMMPGAMSVPATSQSRAPGLTSDSMPGLNPGR
ncbi:hypothetical protein [Nitratidesulfovibrio sp. SRB-5]|uniref:hypothetical protein n=1 Tax=Nitratidesulfovibrio sp. SRB-5 TaxID=2872636 RepID=UPI001024A663|nr:hypothetical protein [Nitratidesulfovibrio sp. SRB-5]MBZ2170897.1 hypothetical protein [Nitratidesulfovibrio sp. SRB-5]RXF77911.1 hypothetical protein EKK70_04430 [Desulfovibrio sp. DS-1]